MSPVVTLLGISWSGFRVVSEPRELFVVECLMLELRRLLLSRSGGKPVRRRITLGLGTSVLGEGAPEMGRRAPGKGEDAPELRRGAPDEAEDAPELGREVPDDDEDAPFFFFARGCSGVGRILAYAYLSL